MLQARGLATPAAGGWLCAIGVCAYYLSATAGRIGFMPLDQSIVFDGGWRVLQGQVPWRDFVLPAGLVPIAMQAAAFAVGGVTWSAYVVHAALFNTAAAGLTFIGLLRIGLPLTAAVAASLATAVWFYPPAGTPYPDQHSLFFAAVAVAAGWRGATGGRAGWWSVAALAAALAVLAKPVPALAILPVAATALLAGHARRTLILGSLAAGAAVAAVVAVVAVLTTFGVAWRDVLEQAWQLPAEVGRDRSSRVLSRLPHALVRMARTMPYTALAAASLLVVEIIWALVTRSAHAATAAYRPAAVTAVAIVAATLLSCAVTQNDFELLFGLVPLAYALLVFRGSGAVRAALTHGGRKWVRATVIAALCLPLAIDAVSGFERLGLRRGAQDITIRAPYRPVAPAPQLAALGFTHWAVPDRYTSADHSLPLLLDWLRVHPEPFLFVGDETVIYGLARRPSVSPWLWYHPGLLFPDTAEGMQQQDVRLRQAIERYGVRWLIVPKDTSWMKWDASSFPVTASIITQDAGQAVGTYRIYAVR